MTAKQCENCGRVHAQVEDDEREEGGEEVLDQVQINANAAEAKLIAELEHDFLATAQRIAKEEKVPIPKVLSRLSRNYPALYRASIEKARNRR